jgi:hypothetical protein
MEKLAKHRIYAQLLTSTVRFSASDLASEFCRLWGIQRIKSRW